MERTRHEIRCDGPGEHGFCRNVADDSWSRKEARKNAERDGWKIVRDGWFSRVFGVNMDQHICPTCQLRQASKAEAEAAEIEKRRVEREEIEQRWKKNFGSAIPPEPEEAQSITRNEDGTVTASMEPEMADRLGFSGDQKGRHRA